jgi:deoxyribodipyrimidine photo-lyase
VEGGGCERALQARNLSRVGAESHRIARGKAQVAAVAQRGGAKEAAAALATFLSERLTSYSKGKGNDPSAQCSSRLSAYLHFGQLSPLRVVLETKAWEHNCGIAGKESPTNHFLEEVVVRRELARNFVW